LKIALCTDWFFPRIGGVSSHVAGLALELEKHGHEVAIITKQTNNINGSKCFQSAKSVQLRYVKPLAHISMVLVPPNLNEIREVLRKGGFDIVHAHHAFTPTSLLSIAAAKKLGIPAILTNHTIFLISDAGYLWVPTSYILFPFRRYISKADRVIAVSKTAAEFIGHFTTQERIIVIPNGVDIDRFRPIDSDAANSSAFFVTEKDPTILYVGRLVHRKGVHILLRAMPYVLEAFPRAQLLIAGNGYMYGFIKLLIKRLNIEDNVKLLGFVPDKELPELYNLSDVFVLPSLYSESFGITLLEAMASGKPIVASKVGGIPEVVENGWTGILVRRGNEKDLADAIIKILTDHSLAETLASNARKLVEERYSWSIVTEEIESVYKEVL